MKNPLNPTWKSEALSLFLVIVSFAASFYFYVNFPEKVAVHWNFAGEIDGWASRGFAAFFFPFMVLGMYLLFLVLPMIDPKQERYKEFAKIYHIFKSLIIGFLTLIYFFVGLNGMGYAVPVGMVVPMGVGVLFMIMGNYLGKVKSNWLMGVRTPWTLSNETVWNKTHRLAGKVFMLSGFAFLFIPFLENQYKIFVFITAIAAMVLVPVIYSFVIFKAEERKK